MKGSGWFPVWGGLDGRVVDGIHPLDVVMKMMNFDEWPGWSLVRGQAFISFASFAK